jgi:hypothetical protein
MPKKLRAAILGALLAVLGVVTTGLAGSAGAASVYSCYNGDLCTYAVSNVGVYTSIGGSKIYTIPQGATVQIDCWIQSDGSGPHGDDIFYYGRRPGYTWGIIAGYYLATGHDPVANLGYCS